MVCDGRTQSLPHHQLCSLCREARRSGNWRYDAAKRVITYTYLNMANPAALDADMSFMQADGWGRQPEQASAG